MKKLSHKKLSLSTSTVRVLDGEQLDGAGGAGVNTHTILIVRPTIAAAAAVRCVRPTGTVHTAPCRYPG